MTLLLISGKLYPNNYIIKFNYHYWISYWVPDNRSKNPGTRSPGTRTYRFGL